MRIILKNLERVAIIKIEAILCAKPHESLAIAQHASNGVLRKPVFNGNAFYFYILGYRCQCKPQAKDKKYINYEMPERNPLSHQLVELQIKVKITKSSNEVIPKSLLYFIRLINQSHQILFKIEPLVLNPL